MLWYMYVRTSRELFSDEARNIQEYTRSFEKACCSRDVRTRCSLSCKFAEIFPRDNGTSTECVIAIRRVTIPIMHVYLNDEWNFGGQAALFTERRVVRCWVDFDATMMRDWFQRWESAGESFLPLGGWEGSNDVWRSNLMRLRVR